MLEKDVSVDTLTRTYIKIREKRAFQDNSHLRNRVINDEWREKINDVIINKDSERFEAQIEDLYEFMETEDANIQIKLTEEIRNFIYVWYDEQTSTDYETPILKEIDFLSLGFIEFKEPTAGYIFSNEGWDNDFMEITTSNIWRMSHHFPLMIEDYI